MYYVISDNKTNLVLTAKIFKINKDRVYINKRIKNASWGFADSLRSRQTCRTNCGAMP